MKKGFFLSCLTGLILTSGQVYSSELRAINFTQKVGFEPEVLRCRSRTQSDGHTRDGP